MVLLTEIVPLPTVTVPVELGEIAQVPLQEPAPPAAANVMLALTCVHVESVMPEMEVAPLQLLLTIFSQ